MRIASFTHGLGSIARGFCRAQTPSPPRPRARVCMSPMRGGVPAQGRLTHGGSPPTSIIPVDGGTGGCRRIHIVASAFIRLKMTPITQNHITTDQFVAIECASAVQFLAPRRRLMALRASAGFIAPSRVASQNTHSIVNKRAKGLFGNDQACFRYLFKIFAPWHQDCVWSRFDKLSTAKAGLRKNTPLMDRVGVCGFDSFGATEQPIRGRG